MARLYPHYYYILILCQFCKIYQEHIICFLGKVSSTSLLPLSSTCKVYILWISLKVYFLDISYYYTFPPIRFLVIIYLVHEINCFIKIFPTSLSTFHMCTHFATCIRFIYNPCALHVFWYLNF